MVYACFNRQHRLTDLMARGDPLDQVWLESAGALDFVRKYKFGQLVILSIQGFVQSLRGGAGSSAPPRRDGARSAGAPGRRSPRCLLSLDPAIAAARLAGQRGESP
jgi:hypothetical protein